MRDPNREYCNHVGLFAQNAGDLVRFYTEKMGFDPGEVREISDTLMNPIFGLNCACRLYKLHFGQVTLEIFEPLGETAGRPSSLLRGYNHWGLNVVDKERFSRKLEQAGADVVRVPLDDRFICFVIDPEGNRIEIFDK